MSQKAISVKNVSKHFQIDGPIKKAVISRFANLLHMSNRNTKIQPLKDVSFELKEGESLGIIGKNGAGKTTLLKTISDIYRKDSGHIEVNGKLLFLAGISSGLNDRLSVSDNIYLVGSILGVSNKSLNKIYDEIIDFSGLNDFVNCKVHQLSSGMRQRIAFSILIHSIDEINPDIILLKREHL